MNDAKRAVFPKDGHAEELEIVRPLFLGRKDNAVVGIMAVNARGASIERSTAVGTIEAEDCFALSYVGAICKLEVAN